MFDNDIAYCYLNGLTCTEIAYKMYFADFMCFGNGSLPFKGPVCQAGLFKCV